MSTQARLAGRSSLSTTTATAASTMSFGGGGSSFSFGGGAAGGAKQGAQPFSFGAAQPNNAQQPANASSPAPSGGLFGATGGQTLGGSGASPAGGSSFSFGAPGGSGNLFGGAATGSTTPASKPAFPFGTPATSGSASGPALSSTTPASAPPSNMFAGFGKPAAPAGGGGSLFGQPSAAKPAEGTVPAASPFSGFGGGAASSSNRPAPPAAAPTTGGFSFGAAPSTNAALTSSAPAAALKPAGSSLNTTSTTGGASTTATGGTGGFSFGASKPADGASIAASTPAASSSTAAPSSAAPFSFGTSAPTSNTAAPASQAPSFTGFKTDSKDKPAVQGAGGAVPPTPFSFGGAPTSAPTAPASGTGSNLFAPKVSVPGSSATGASTSTSTAPATTAPTPGSNLFANFGKPAAGSDSKPTNAPATGTTGAPAPVPGASGGPTTSAPVSLPPPNMLRGRSMEEIVNKWSQELENATKEFTRQAAEVAVWDGVLRRGGDDISRLIQTLQAAEERQSSIEQTLDYVEQQQADLTSLLDGYEAQVTDLLQGAMSSGLNAYGSQAITRSMETGAADAEREKAYAMAESLNSQLDELSRNLSSMIVEVNSLSSSTAANASRPHAEPDANALGPLRLGNKLHSSGADPVSQIVAILNAHLGSLKWIDESTNALREKVENLRRGQVGSNGEARTSRDRVTGSPAAHREDPGASTSRNRQSSIGPGQSSDSQLRASSVGLGYSRGASVGRNAGSGWSEATIATGGGSNLGRSRGYGL